MYIIFILPGKGNEMSGNPLKIPTLSLEDDDVINGRETGKKSIW